MFIEGVGCSLYPDSEAAVGMRIGKHLQLWNNDQSRDLWVDRFDVRGLVSVYSSLSGLNHRVKGNLGKRRAFSTFYGDDDDSGPREGDEEDDAALEAELSYERYRDLLAIKAQGRSVDTDERTESCPDGMTSRHDVKDLNVGNYDNEDRDEDHNDGEPTTTSTTYSSKSGASGQFAGVGFDYGYKSNRIEIWTKSAPETYSFSDYLVLPPGVSVPPTKREFDIILRTAKNVRQRGGAQLEILLKLKQQYEVMFEFLEHDSPLNILYKHLLKLDDAVFKNILNGINIKSSAEEIDKDEETTFSSKSEQSVLDILRNMYDDENEVEEGKYEVEVVKETGKRTAGSNDIDSKEEEEEEDNDDDGGEEEQEEGKSSNFVLNETQQDLGKDRCQDEEYVALQLISAPQPLLTDQNELISNAEEAVDSTSSSQSSHSFQQAAVASTSNAVADASATNATNATLAKSGRKQYPDYPFAEIVANLSDSDDALYSDIDASEFWGRSFARKRVKLARMETEKEAARKAQRLVKAKQMKNYFLSSGGSNIKNASSSSSSSNSSNNNGSSMESLHDFKRSRVDRGQDIDCSSVPITLSSGIDPALSRRLRIKIEQALASLTGNLQ